MAYLSSIDENKPSGSSEKVSALDDRIRECRGAVKNTVAAEHHLDSGAHKIPFGNTANRPTGKDGRLYINTQLSQLEYYDSSWKVAANAIPAGTKMLFVQNSAPTGWTFVSTWNDKVIMVTSTLADGGSTGGNWTISGIQSAGAHQHDAAGAHKHLFMPVGVTGSGVREFAIKLKDNMSNWPFGYTSSGGHNMLNKVYTGEHFDDEADFSDTWLYTEQTGSHQHASAGGHTHSFDSTWRPAYLSVIVCEKS